jgi:hypothetical protein
MNGTSCDEIRMDSSAVIITSVPAAAAGQRWAGTFSIQADGKIDEAVSPDLPPHPATAA